MTALSGNAGASLAGAPRRTGAHRRAPNGRSLERNSLALTASALLTGMVGMVYWAVLGRLYPAREVGAAAAIITTATMLSAFGNFSLGALYERFLPLAGARARGMVRAGFLAGAGFGVVLGGGFLLLGPTGEMFTHPVDMIAFPVVVAVFSAFALLDHTAVGLREAGWAAGKNVTHALVKLVLAVACAFTASSMAIVWTWTIPAVVGIVVVGVAVTRRLRSPAYMERPADLPPRREMLDYLAASYGIYVVGALAPLMLPLIVIARLGADANAYFAISWSLVTSVLVLMTMLMGPYVAATANDPDRVRALTLKFLTVLAAVCVGGIVLFAVLGPWMLSLVGERYAEEGTPLLRLAAVALAPAVVVIAYTAVARVHRKLRLAVAVQLLNATLILGLTLMLISDHGLATMGWAYIVAETVSASILMIPLVRSIAKLTDSAQPSVN